MLAVAPRQRQGFTRVTRSCSSHDKRRAIRTCRSPRWPNVSLSQRTQATPEKPSTTLSLKKVQLAPIFESLGYAAVALLCVRALLLNRQASQLIGTSAKALSGTASGHDHQFNILVELHSLHLNSAETITLSHVFFTAVQLGNRVLKYFEKSYHPPSPKFPTADAAAKLAKLDSTLANQASNISALSRQVEKVALRTRSLDVTVKQPLGSAQDALAQQVEVSVKLARELEVVRRRADTLEEVVVALQGLMSKQSKVTQEAVTQLNQLKALHQRPPKSPPQPPPTGPIHSGRGGGNGSLPPAHTLSGGMTGGQPATEAPGSRNGHGRSSNPSTPPDPWHT